MAILVGDIGGTKTNLALFEHGQKIHAEKKFLSKDYPSLQEIIKEFQRDHLVPITKACFAVAGSIANGRCKMTNLPWIIEAKELGQQLGTDKVFLINDLLANAYGLRCLKPDEIAIITVGNPKQQGNQALISAGTGLGEAGLIWNGIEHQPFESEGGHVDFAPRNELEIELLRYLKHRFSHASYERVLSGPGLYNLYQFLIDMNIEEASDDVTHLLTHADPARVITEQALKKKNQACVHALEWFCSIYGSEAGNTALKFMATGGVYVGGGIAPKILPDLLKGGFIKAFMDKGRFSSFLSTIPVKVVINPNAALLGAAYFADVH